MIYLATVLIGLALFSLRVAAEWYRGQIRQADALDHASKIFPHPNETKKTYQKRP